MDPIENPKKYTFTFTAFQLVCLGLAAILMIAGSLGMVASFLYLASRSMEDITAGASGFIVGSILIGSGVISLSLIGRPVSPQ